MRGVTRVKRWERRLILDGQISLTSFSFHPLGVKGERGGKCVNIRKNNNSLFFFLSFTPIRSRNTNSRVHACVRGEQCELSKLAMVPSRRISSGEVSGNSRAIEQSLFCLSE